MAMTQLSVLFLMSLAALASIGLLADIDSATAVLLGLLGSVLWGVSGLASFSVYSQAWNGARQMRLLSIVDIGMAALVLLLTLGHLRRAVADSTGATSQVTTDRR